MVGPVKVGGAPERAYGHGLWLLATTTSTIGQPTRHDHYYFTSNQKRTLIPKTNVTQTIYK